MFIDRKDEFLAYIDRLPTKETTNKIYRNWIRRIEEDCPGELSSLTVRYENDVISIADSFPKEKYTPKHLKDIRCLIRYYLKFSVSDAVAREQERASDEGLFNFTTATLARERVSRSIALRRGQARFREILLNGYGHKCAVTDTAVEEILEAAHIRPYSESGTNEPSNGLLLRSDIHTLFDLELISANPDSLAVYCSPKIRASADYAKLHGRVLRLPNNPALYPDRALLLAHYNQTKG